MLIRSVTAQAFGPLIGQTLEFADGMTVVHGANESAKSTWHAAIYAALCGRRRGRVPSVDERRFAELHRPWDRDDWVVRAEVLLDDGRRLEVRQDLAGRVDCDVRDLDLGRDCSDEFLRDGTPDLARWLGLDRQSFLATAWVAQAQVLDIHSRAGGLQEQLQRAAATAGADQTAAAALTCIDTFRRDQVGTDRAATRPLRVAMAALARAEVALADARAARLAYQQRLIESDRLRDAAAEAERRLRRHEAVAAARAAGALGQRAADVDALLAGKAEPPSPAADESIARDVSAALSAWDSRPAALPIDLEQRDASLADGSTAGPATIESPPTASAAPAESSSAEPLLAQSSWADSSGESSWADSFMAEPLSVAPSVAESASGGSLVEVSLGGPSVVDRSGLAPPDASDGGGGGGLGGADPVQAAGLTDERLWDLARDLDVVTAPPDPSIQARVTMARATRTSADQARRRGRRLLLVGSALAAVAVVALAMGLTGSSRMLAGAGVAGLLGAGAAMLVVAGALASRAGDPSTIQGELDAALLEAAAALRAEQIALARQEQARSLAQRWGLPPSADSIRQLIQSRAASTLLAEREQEWQRRVLATQRQVTESQRQVTETQRQFLASEQRAAQTQQRFAESQRRVAQTHRQIVDARQRAADQVHAAARRCGITAADPDAVTDPDAAVVALRQWQLDQSELIAAWDQAVRRWSRLQSLLGLALEAPSAEVRAAAADLRQAADDAQRLAIQAGAAFSPADLAVVTDTRPATLAELREQVRAADTDLGAADGSRRESERNLVPVGEAEEELARAEAQLLRLRELDRTLELTRAFLADAQERAHRTIAPVLVGSVSRWLPATTGGRYTDVIVDPERLRVQVRGPAGRWRDANALSHGTAEQIYLLLRIALAQHLARPGTVCPLLLDDVTVHADTQRTEQILELLLAAAQERQIILFTQQDQVRDWAGRLDDPRHAIRALTALPSV